MIQADEDVLCLQISEGMLPFEQKHCPECGGEGKVPAGNVRGVMLDCKPCAGTGLLRGDPEQLIKRFLAKDFYTTIHRVPLHELSWYALKTFRPFMDKLKEDKHITGFSLNKLDMGLEVTYWAKGLGRNGRQLRITFEAPRR